MEITKPMESIDYKILLEISQSTATVRTRDELQAFIDDRVKPRFGFNEHWNIYIYNPKLNTLELLFTNKITQQNSESVLAFMQPFQAEGIFRQIIETSEIVQNDDSWGTSLKTNEIDKISGQVWLDFNFKYALSITLRSFGQIIGTFHATFNEHKAFTESQMQLFKSLADQVAIALGNVLANEEATEREREKALLLSISEQMATIRDRSDLRRVLTQTIKPLINFEVAVVTALSEDQTQFSHFLIATPDDKIIGGNLSTGGSMRQLSDTPHEYLLTLPSPHVVDIEELLALYPDYFERYPGLEKRLGNVISFQMQWGDRLLGLFLLGFKSKEHPPESKLNLYKAIANQIAVAVGTILTNERSAQLAEELRQRAEELAESNQAIARTSERLSALSDLSAFLGQVTIEAARQLNADAGNLTVFNEKENTFQIMALFEADKLVNPSGIPVSNVSKENL